MNKLSLLSSSVTVAVSIASVSALIYFFGLPFALMHGAYEALVYAGIYGGVSVIALGVLNFFKSRSLKNIKDEAIASAQQAADAIQSAVNKATT